MKPKEHQAPAPSPIHPFPNRDSSPVPFWGLCTPWCLCVTFSWCPGHSWTCTAGKPSIYPGKRASVHLSPPQNNSSHTENPLWLQLLHSGCARVRFFSCFFFSFIILYEVHIIMILWCHTNHLSQTRLLTSLALGFMIYMCLVWSLLPYCPLVLCVS